MDKSKPILDEINRKILSDPDLVVKIHLNTAKNLFILASFLYFFFYLMTIGGVFPEYSAILMTITFPVLAFSAALFLYNGLNYVTIVYFESWKSFKYAYWVISIAFFAISMVAQFQSIVKI